MWGDVVLHVRVSVSWWIPSSSSSGATKLAANVHNISSQSVLSWGVTSPSPAARLDLIGRMPPKYTFFREKTKQDNKREQIWNTLIKQTLCGVCLFELEKKNLVTYWSQAQVSAYYTNSFLKGMARSACVSVQLLCWSFIRPNIPDKLGDYGKKNPS